MQNINVQTQSMYLPLGEIVGQHVDFSMCPIRYQHLSPDKIRFDFLRDSSEIVIEIEMWKYVEPHTVKL